MVEKRERRGENMEKTRRGRVMNRTSGLCVLLMALLPLPLHTSAQNTTNTSTTSTNSSSAQQSQAGPPGYNTFPGNLTVAAGEPATFRCGVSPVPSKLTLTLYGGHGNYSLTCPGGDIDDIPQALHGSCKMHNGELLALWTITGTSYSDNSTRVVCQQPGHPDTPAAFLQVYESGSNYATIIGCVIGGFFGILLVFYLAFLMVQRSETLQRWFGGSGSEEDDVVTIVTKEDD